MVYAKETGRAMRAERLPNGAVRPLVLIVDDEEAMRDSCTQVLRREGFEVATVPDGESALALMGKRLPEVMIVDLKMPGMSGRELILKAKEMDPEAVPVAITGYATLVSAVDAMKTGAYDFLPKPFKADELRIITRRALEKRRLSLVAASAEHEKIRMRDHFVAVVSHQLKSPLASLKECLDVAITCFSDEVSDTCKDLLLRASRRADLLLNLIGDWLTLARTESEGMVANACPVDIGRVVGDAIATAQECPRSHGVDVQYCDATGERRLCRGDAEALRQLFINVIENAVRYTPDGGKVRVDVSPESAGIVVSVADSGPGIPQEDQGLVFEPFFRGAEAKKTDGTGLGLAIARQIAEAHHGHISLDSEVGQGTTFKVFLPAGEEN